MYEQDKIETNEYELSYVPDEVEGECVLLAILPVRLNTFKYVLYIIFSILTLGILPLLTYWQKQSHIGSLTSSGRFVITNALYNNAPIFVFKTTTTQYLSFRKKLDFSSMAKQKNSILSSQIDIQNTILKGIRQK